MHQQRRKFPQIPWVRVWSAARSRHTPYRREESADLSEKGALRRQRDTRRRRIPDATTATVTVETSAAAGSGAGIGLVALARPCPPGMGPGGPTASFHLSGVA